MTLLINATRRTAFAHRQRLFLLRTGSGAATNSFSTVGASSALDGLYSLLNYKEREILKEQRELTEASRKLASQVGGEQVAELLHNTKSLNFLEDLNLATTFSIVIAGEFNAGKSTLINALLGDSLLESGSLPTTDTITIVANQKDSTAATTTSSSLPLGVTLHSLQNNLPLLNDLTFIDTPGTNSAWMDHTERTMRLLPSADLILFVTSADRPFSDSERSLLKSIQAYRKSIVVLINKMDVILEENSNHTNSSDTNNNNTAADKIIEFVTDHASELLGARPIVIPISSRNALKAKLDMKASDNNSSQDPHERWKESNFASLETFLRDSLTTETRIRSKLTSPIGVAEGIMVQCLETLKIQKNELQEDTATLNLLKSQFEGWSKELAADLNGIRQSIAHIVQKEGQRGEMLMSRINLYNFYAWTLFGSMKRFAIEWKDTKRQASLHRQKDLQAELLDQVNETADSVASRGRAQQQVVLEYLGNRPTIKHQSLVGSVAGTSRFEDTRKALGTLMSDAVKITLEGSKDDNYEKEHIFNSLKNLAMTSAVLQVGAAGTGILSATTNILDPVSGLALSSGFFLGGNACYWIGTSQLSKNYQTQWSGRAQQLEDALNAICSKELEKVNRRILDGVAPYTRFVESEQERIDQLRDECEGVAAAARSLRNKIGKLS